MTTPLQFLIISIPELGFRNRRHRRYEPSRGSGGIPPLENFGYFEPQIRYSQHGKKLLFWKCSDKIFAIFYSLPILITICKKPFGANFLRVVLRSKHARLTGKTCTFDRQNMHSQTRKLISLDRELTTFYNKLLHV